MINSKKKKLTLFLAAALFTVQINAQQLITNQSPEVNISGFDCVEPVEQFIPLLGRGNSIESFLVNDVEKELIRQSKRSILLDIKCNDDAWVKASTTDIERNGEIHQALSKLMVTFPLTLTVQNRSQRIVLEVEHSYFTENLETTDQRKTTQQFKVLQQR